MTAQPASSAGTATDPAAVAKPAPVPAPSALWVERTGTRTYTGRSSRGAQVLIGPSSDAGVFTPGELLKIALAGCSGLTSDAAFARRLGPDYAATVRVAGLSDEAEDRYPHLTEELVVDLSGLAPPERERLLAVVQRAIDKHCTVARTLAVGASVELTITSGSAAAAATVEPDEAVDPDEVAAP